MKAKLIKDLLNEINFERGLDPIDSMNIGIRHAAISSALGKTYLETLEDYMEDDFNIERSGKKLSKQEKIEKERKLKEILGKNVKNLRIFDKILNDFFGGSMAEFDQYGVIMDGFELDFSEKDITDYIESCIEFTIDELEQGIYGKEEDMTEYKKML